MPLASTPPRVHAPVAPATLTDPEATIAAWQRWITRTGLAPATKRVYTVEVRLYARWLASPDAADHDPALVFADPDARDYAVRDYRRWLLTVRKLAPKSVTCAITALRCLYQWTGLGPPQVPSQPRQAPGPAKALRPEQARALMRSAARRGARDLALVSLGLNTGLRLAELVALDVDDYWASERRGLVQVRAGKGDQPRTVPLNGQVRDHLAGWARERARRADPERGALFLAAGGGRLAGRSAMTVVRACGRGAELEVSMHVLRHTFATTLSKGGEGRGPVPIDQIATLLGHRDVNTTRRYLTASAVDLEAAVEAAAVDY